MEAPLLQDTELNDLSGSDVEAGDEPYWRATTTSTTTTTQSSRGTRSRSNFTYVKRRMRVAGLGSGIRIAVIAVVWAAMMLLGIYFVLRGLDITGTLFPSFFLHDTTKSDEKAVFDASGNLIRHPHYIVFDKPSLGQHRPASLADIPLRPARRLPDSCIDAHFARGEPCYDDRPSTFDLVWTWVNASDWRLQEEMRKALDHFDLPASDEQAGESDSKLYRDHDELRHSLRSVLRHFRPYIRQFNIFTSDFPFSQDTYTRRVANTTTTDPNNTTHPASNSNPSISDIPIPNNDTIRLGQLPRWLRTQDEGWWRDGDVLLKMAYQSQVFREFDGLSFNSFGIETQLPHLHDIGHNVIYLNDDFYFTADLIPADFYTSAYGAVLRFDIGFLIDPERIAEGDPAGEWGPLKYTSWLLSERFGTRSRPYVKHAPKSLPLPLLDEAAHIWEREFRETAAHKFRGVRSAGGREGREEEGREGLWDVHPTFLVPHLMVERWREALLWGWVVGRVGGVGDEWGEGEKGRAWVEVGGGWGAGVGAGGKVGVRMGERRTLEGGRVGETLGRSGEGVSRRTKYGFSSLDGYPYGFVDAEGQTTLPEFVPDDDHAVVNTSREICVLDFDECFDGVSSASEAFKRIAFERHHCGDCVIHALRAKSGELGLSAFLPLSDREYVPPEENTLLSELLGFDAGDGSPPEEDSSGLSSPSTLSSGSSSSVVGDAEEMEDEPHLPLDNSWRTAKFALRDVLESYGSSGGSVNVRRWVERVLERYRFIIGDSNVLFLMIENPDAARGALGGISDDVSLLCMNDDVKEGFWETDRILRDWQERRWGVPAQWERS